MTCTLDAAHLRDVLSAAQAQHKPIVTGRDMFWNVFVDDFRFPDLHAFTILHVDSGGADGGTVTVQNPWDKLSGEKRTFDLSVHDFRRLFTRVFVGG